jgi:hypothetical protein
LADSIVDFKNPGLKMLVADAARIAPVEIHPELGGVITAHQGVTLFHWRCPKLGQEYAADLSAPGVEKVTET